MLYWLDKHQPRYERQLEEVKYEVLRDAEITEEKLRKILEVLYKHRVID